MESLRQTGGLGVLLDLGFQRRFVYGPDNGVDHRSVLEIQDARDGPNAELRGDGTVSVNIHLADFHPALVVACKFLDHRSYHAAWATPLGPEVYYGQALR